MAPGMQIPGGFLVGQPPFSKHQLRIGPGIGDEKEFSARAEKNSLQVLSMFLNRAPELSQHNTNFFSDPSRKFLEIFPSV